MRESFGDNHDATPSRSGSSLGEPLTPTSTRRLRLAGFARSTRDTYMPRITTSVSSLASMASGMASGVATRAPSDGSLPKDTSITLFPSYTTEIQSDDNSHNYRVNVKGWLSCPGQLTRKNRLILSLARQIAKYGSESSTASLESMSQDVSDAASAVDAESDSGSIASAESRDRDRNPDPLRERLQAFIARSIANAPLTITVGSKSTETTLVSAKVSTDAYGHFDKDIVVPYVPSVVQVCSDQEETILAFQDIMFVPPHGLGVISDIDDTVKLTGVIGDKRELMANLLLNEIESWTIPSMVKWYSEWVDTLDVSFHYVSNSPWQLFHVLNQYFHLAKLPLGSVHLKQYTGNIMASLMEPLLSRKKRELTKILRDFPAKKFVCIGDSGEKDLEAYVDLAKAYPNSIIAIYIRYVEDSMSEIDDSRILDEIERIIKIDKKKRRPAPPSADLIDLSDTRAEQRLAKLPPMVPKKPESLKGNQVSASPPPLPKRTSTLSDEKPPLPARTYIPIDEEYDVYDQLHQVYHVNNYWEIELMDKRGAQWLARVAQALELLKNTNTELHFFTDKDEDFFKEAINIVSQHVKQDAQDIL